MSQSMWALLCIYDHDYIQLERIVNRDLLKQYSRKIANMHRYIIIYYITCTLIQCSNITNFNKITYTTWKLLQKLPPLNELAKPNS